MARFGLFRQAWRVSARSAQDRSGTAGKATQVTVRLGTSWQARHVESKYGGFRLGVVWQARFVLASYGAARFGVARQARHGEARLVMARRGVFMHGRQGKAGIGAVCSGEAR